MTALNWEDEERYRNDESVGVRITPEEAEKMYRGLESKMNADQKNAFDTIVNSYKNPLGRRLFFLQVYTAILLLFVTNTFRKLSSGTWWHWENIPVYRTLLLLRRKRVEGKPRCVKRAIVTCLNPRFSTLPTRASPRLC